MEIRPALSSDTPEILRLLSNSLGWMPDENHAALFSWKHEQNPFGRSLAWVAEEAGRIVGFRTFLRWDFERDGDVVHAVRAVDTATHPAHRGKGVFSRLTLHSLEELRRAGIAFVFNTPNKQSRPGYLKMGWRTLGRVPTMARPRSLTAIARMGRARTAADLWSVPTTAAVAAGEALADTMGVDRLLGLQRPSSVLRTRRSPQYLRWRYAALPSLFYRAYLMNSGPVKGMALFRLRSRGGALEAVIGDVLVPGRDPRQIIELAADVARFSGADYAIARSIPHGLSGGFLPLPRQGPVVAWRPLGREARVCEPSLLELTLGDVELF